MARHEDTTRRRKADSQRLLRRLERLEACGPLYFHTVPLWPGSVWDGSDIEAARLAASSILAAVGQPPAWVKLEAGRGGMLHLHIVTPARWLGIVPGAVRVPVWNLARLAAYLSKPHDARQARRRPHDLGRFSDEELRLQFLASLEEEAAARRARHGRRVSPRAWSFSAAPGWRPASASAWALYPLALASLARLALTWQPGRVLARPPLKGARPVPGAPVARWRAPGLWSACVGRRAPSLPG